MSLFKSKEERELDAIILKLESNVSNNYKDAAQENFRAFEERFGELQAAGTMKPKREAYYQHLLDTYRSRLKEFTHKDQKPYWT